MPTQPLVLVISGDGEPGQSKAGEWISPVTLTDTLGDSVNAHFRGAQ
ncbi:MAG: hypothetical protein ACREX3_20120 [Gammaproteobacteria bacterium]